MQSRLSASIGRLTALGALALLLGLGLAHDASARIQRTDVPISTRVANQNDLCTLDGGTPSTSTNSQTGSVSTYCNGGGRDHVHCINTAKTTDCHIDRVLPPSGRAVAGASGYGGVLSAEPGGSAAGQTGAGSGQTAQVKAVTGTHSHPAAHHGHAGKAHGK
jgi:hypothetical protein